MFRPNPISPLYSHSADRTHPIVDRTHPIVLAVMSRVTHLLYSNHSHLFVHSSPTCVHTHPGHPDPAASHRVTHPRGFLVDGPQRMASEGSSEYLVYLVNQATVKAFNSITGSTQDQYTIRWRLFKEFTSLHGVDPFLTLSRLGTRMTLPYPVVAMAAFIQWLQLLETPDKKKRLFGPTIDKYAFHVRHYVHPLLFTSHLKRVTGLTRSTAPPSTPAQ